MVRLRHFTAAAAALAGTALAAPAADVAEIEKRAITDIDILQFALTLEHLENVFYKQALKNFTLADFTAAGYSADYYNDVKYIAFDEQTHVLTLEAAIKAAGATPVKACTYTFPVTDVPSFVYVSQALENTGTSAYLGAAPLIKEKIYLTVAGAILGVEAIHTSLERAALGEVPMANPFETPLDGNSVYTLASQFIVKCPASNYKLPFHAFPYLTYDGPICTCEEPQCGNPSQYIKKRGEEPHHWHPHPHPHPHPTKPTSSYSATASSQPTCTPPSAGSKVTFTAVSKIPAGSYVTFVNGLEITSVKGTISGDKITATVPTGLGLGYPSGFGGQAYVFVTSKDLEGTFSDAAVLFGPAILEINPPAPQINYNILKA